MTTPRKPRQLRVGGLRFDLQQPWGNTQLRIVEPHIGSVIIGSPTPTQARRIAAWFQAVAEYLEESK